MYQKRNQKPEGEVSVKTAEGKKKKVSVARTPDPVNAMLFLYTLAALLCILLGGVLKAEAGVSPVAYQVDSAASGQNAPLISDRGAMGDTRQ